MTCLSRKTRNIARDGYPFTAPTRSASCWHAHQKIWLQILCASKSFLSPADSVAGFEVDLYIVIPFLFFVL
jgi:hypothetical protein